MNTIFQHEDFSCDIEIFNKGDDILVRFYDKSAEQKESEIHDLVIVDPGFGVLCLKFKGRAGLLSGFLSRDVFSEAAAESAIDFVESLSPRGAGAYIPHHVRLFGGSSYVEYNGEY